MLCRVADDVFWMSRYVERAVAVVRLIDVTWHLELDAGELDDDDADLWGPLVGSMDDDDAPVRVGNGRTVLTPADVRHYLAFDQSNPSSLLSCVRRARAAARGVREVISSEMWEQINTLYLSLVEPERVVEAEESPHTFYRRVLQGAMFFQGLADSTLAHEEAWDFISLGKYLERADGVARVLNLQAHLLLSGESSGGGDDTVRWLAVLRSCGASEAYSRYYSLRVEPARVIEFLLLNPTFPQSVRFSLGAAWDAMKAIAGVGTLAAERPNPAMRSLGLLRARFEHAAVDELLAEGLRTHLSDVRRRIARVSEEVTTTYLRAEAQPGRLVAVARAAMIMAAQQQQ